MRCPDAVSRRERFIVIQSEFLGRSQAVRHRVLIPASPGSNPGAPAIPLQTASDATCAALGEIAGLRV
ncbi:hypothetical protein THIOKS12650015 [Thiocapsa sp. KS1]|nr:hypothetical protein THIOKS12650015 [Thiocapsa sp. KS1]